MGLVLNKSISITSRRAGRLIYSQDMKWPRVLPFAAVDGQDPSSWALSALMGDAHIPPTGLQLIELEDAAFAIGGGYDGLILTQDGSYVAETSLFSGGWNKQSQQVSDQELEILLDWSETKFDEVFVGFDAGWWNYFHWLCYALAKSYIACRVLPRSCAIIVPDYQRSDVRRRAFSEDTWRESLNVAELLERVLPLPPGLYRAAKIYFLWPTHPAPTELFNLDVFYRVFSELRSKLDFRPRSARRIFITRIDAPDRRISAKDQADIEGALISRGFTPIALEHTPFIEQAELFFNADIVVGAHGSGLTNLLFGSDRLRVLELNRQAPEGILRPWFYALATQRGLRYSFIDGSDGFSVPGVIEATERLLTT
jgi:hypothetical protein